MELIKKVIEQIKKDLEIKDETSICELLKHLDEKTLKAFLSEV